MANLNDAAAALAATGFDALVLDLDLPDEDGCEWLKTRRAAGETVPALILTTRPTAGDKVMCSNLRADDYLAKPFEVAELVARLNASSPPGCGWDLTLQVGNMFFDIFHRGVTLGGDPVGRGASD